jgi:hypothetical protein
VFGVLAADGVSIRTKLPNPACIYVVRPVTEIILLFFYFLLVFGEQRSFKDVTQWQGVSVHIR